ncbi:uncharacterized protein LOC120326359 [Styela clava]
MSDATAIERVEDLMDEVVRLMPNEEWLTFSHNSRWLAISDETIDEIVPDIENITKMQKYKILKMWKRRIGMEANGAKLKEIFQNFMQNYEMSQSQGQSQPASQQTEVIQEGAAAQNMASPRYRIGPGTTREVLFSPKSAWLPGLSQQDSLLDTAKRIITMDKLRSYNFVLVTLFYLFFDVMEQFLFNQDRNEACS